MIRKVLATPHLWLVLLGLFLLLLLTPDMPVLSPRPDIDASLNLYMAARIRQGDLIYRDVWNHHPPGMFYLDALGLWLTQGSRWGPWALEFLALLGALLVGYKTIKTALGRTPALVGSAAWLATLPFVRVEENEGETFALVPAFGALWLILHSEKGRTPLRSLFLVGILSGASLLLKFDTVGLVVAIGVAIAWRRIVEKDWRGLALRFTALSLGAAATWLPFVVYFAAKGILGDFWEAAVLYPAKMASGQGATSRLAPAVFAVWALARSGLAPLGVAGWLCALWSLRHGSSQALRQQPLLAVSMVSLPVWFSLSLFDRFWFAHHTIPWLPAFAILFSYLFAALTRKDAEFFSEPGGGGGPYISGGVVGLAMSVAMLSVAAMGTVSSLRNVDDTQEYREKVAYKVEYVKSHSQPTDTVFFWGVTNLNFVTERRAPSRFFFLAPLFRGTTDEEALQELFDDIRSAKPKLIIDTASLTTSHPPLDPGLLEEWRKTSPITDPVLKEKGSQVELISQYVLANYRKVETAAPPSWVVYEYRGEQE